MRHALSQALCMLVLVSLPHGAWADEPGETSDGAADAAAEPPKIVKDGCEFEILVPEQSWPIPAKPAGRSPIKLGLKITNKTDAPLRFSRLDALHPRMTGADGKDLEASGGRNGIGRATAADFPLVKAGESTTFWIDANLSWQDDKLRLGGMDGFGGVWGFADELREGRYQIRIRYLNVQKAFLQRRKVAGEKDMITRDPMWAGEITTPPVEVSLVELQDLKARPVGQLIADLEALDGAARAAASAELFRRGKEVLPDLKAAGAKQVAPFGGTVDSTRRKSIIYSLLEGLPPNEPEARAGYRTDSFGLHLGGGAGEKDVIEMGKKRGFSLGSDRYRAEGQPQCYVTIDKDKSLASVIISVLSTETRVITVNLNYFEQ